MFEFLTGGFPRKINHVYLYFEWGRKKYCTKLWKNINWNIGGIVPMLKKNGYTAYYEITAAYREGGDGMSDWAWGDDGRYRDFKYHHKEKMS